MVANAALVASSLAASLARAEEPSDAPRGAQPVEAAADPTLQVAGEPDDDAEPSVAPKPLRPEPVQRVAVPPPPPAPQPQRAERWYGWQILLAHGLSDSLAIAGVFLSYENTDAALGLTASSWIARGGTSALIEAVHGGEWEIYGASNLLASSLGAAVLGRNTVDALHAPADPSTGAFVRGLALGGIATAGIVTAIEASLAFEPDPEGAFVVVPSANGVSVRGAF